MFSARIMPLSLSVSLSLALSDFMFVNNKQNTVACNDSVCFSSMDSYMTLNLSACGSSCSCVRFVRYLRDCSPRGMPLSLSLSLSLGLSLSLLLSLLLVCHEKNIVALKTVFACHP